MYYLTFHGANDPDKVLDAMGHAVYIYDIAHVIIDNMQFMLGSGNGALDRFSQQDQVSHPGFYRSVGDLTRYRAHR